MRQSNAVSVAQDFAVLVKSGIHLVVLACIKIVSKCVYFVVNITYEILTVIVRCVSNVYRAVRVAITREGDGPAGN